MAEPQVDFEEDVPAPAALVGLAQAGGGAQTPFMRTPEQVAPQVQVPAVQPAVALQPGVEQGVPQSTHPVRGGVRGARGGGKGPKGRAQAARGGGQPAAGRPRQMVRTRAFSSSAQQLEPPAAIPTRGRRRGRDRARGRGLLLVAPTASQAGRGAQTPTTRTPE
uniref:Translation initiation factor IF-2-like n=1 Tax=Nicotiana tabacum TaxID=4097 RepID=A0A1S4AFI4_TOBAC|nr:PREDICTED: uncharacterized protein LOC107796919 [Nicotiana tabacum]